MNKPMLAKNIAKLALMGIGSLLIGTIIKTEKKLVEQVDAHFATETEAEPAQDN
jgi:hypothetical protein